MRNLILWAVLALILAVANWSILSKERILADGQTMLLELAPRDPRSLLQGDYMQLRYSLARDIEAELGETFSASGTAIVRLDRDNVATFSRLAASDSPLADAERRLRYRKRGESLRVAGDAFFFEEGQAALYETARFGELRVDASGEAVLVGLRDDDFNRLGPGGAGFD
jgi:uncharacterized membrane-anchored protein